MTTRTARCSCGQLSITLSGDPARVSVCHCRACQRRTGSTYGAQGSFRDDQIVAQAGQATTYVRTGDGGMHIHFRFCPTCGATVSYRLEGVDGKIIVPVGAFADKTLPAPTFSVYEERMHPWVTVPEDIEHMD